MATQAGYVGRIGNLINYRMGDKYYSRLAPRKYKQTKATKAKASEFGMASTIGRLIRQNLDSVIFNSADNKMQTSLVREIFEWLQIARNQPASSVTQPLLEGFKFSTECPQPLSRWKAKFDVSNPVSGQLQITIPSFVPKTSFIAPGKTTNIVCKIASVVIDVKNRVEIASAINKISYMMDKNKVESQVIVQDLTMPKGSLLVTGMCLEFLTSQRQTLVPTKDKLFQPSQIVYAVYS
jgi:hypothetical protein